MNLKINIRIILLLILFIPTLTIISCYVIAANADHVPRGNPFLENLTTVTSVGTHPVEEYIFRLFMLPGIILFLLASQYFKQWLIYISKGELKKLATRLYITTIINVIILDISLSVMGYPLTSFFESVHTVAAVVFFTVQAIIQSTFTIYDIKYRNIENKFALAVRIICLILHSVIVVYFIVYKSVPISKRYYLPEWWLIPITCSWYGTFLLDKMTTKRQVKLVSIEAVKSGL